MYLNVLVIDDSNIDRILSELMIKKAMFARNVVSCNSVADGLSYLKGLIDDPEKFPTVIFLDINMPVSDGFDFLNNFLRFPKEVRERCNIFMVSATNSRSDFERIKKYPIVRKFYNKPLTLETLNDIRENLENEEYDTENDT